MKAIFVIEHLEPHLWKWCEIEYKSISRIVGKKNLYFTNTASSKLAPYGKVIKRSVSSLNLPNCCILDPLAPETLSPLDAKDIKYVLVGGILGEEQLNGRTKRELSVHFPHALKRNIGKEQFSTDNAVYVAHEILKGKSLRDFTFKDTIEIPINKIESVILPYRYPLINNKPRISPELIRYLKNKKTF